MTIPRNLSLFAQGTFASGGVSIGNTTDPGATNLSVTGFGTFGAGLTNASGWFYTAYNSTSRPTSGFGLAVSANYSGANTEVDFWNIWNSSGQAFSFKQKTGASTHTDVLNIDGSGSITISGATATKASGTTWANPSDKRLKENIIDYSKGLKELSKISVKTWEYNGKGGTTTKTKGIGVIADDVMLILPDSVDTYKAKLNSDDDENSEIKRFDATEITWLLVNSLKELNDKFDAYVASHP